MTDCDPQQLNAEPANNGTQSEHHIIKTQSYEGPFPPPVLLKQFEEVLPGSAERIFQYSEREQKHRHDIENKQIETISTATKVNTYVDVAGRVFGMVFLVVTFLAALHFSFVDRSWDFACLFYSPSIIAGLVVLIKGRSK